MICSTMRANRRSKAPVKTMREETSVLIIEKEEEAKSRERRTKGNETVAKVGIIVQVLLRQVVIT